MIRPSSPGDAHAAGAEPPRAFHSYAVNVIYPQILISKYFGGASAEAEPPGVSPRP
jgi:hypothetical protein